MAPPLRDHLPIYLAGVNPVMVAVAGAVADGLVGHPMFTTEYLDAVVHPAVAKGAANAERSASDVAIAGIKMCAIDDDEGEARRQAAYAIGQYAASRVYDRLFELHGWTTAQQRIRQAARDRDTPALIAAVPEEAIDTIAIASTRADFADRLTRASTGFDHLTLTPPPWGLTDEQTRDATWRIIEALRPVNLHTQPTLELST
jgi:alkanesulfonate monooxygenase SsuD/methylene tetrahydromethanopterin reductase-like flavin-dependent oxidoreductase (luciferase family)